MNMHPIARSGITLLVLAALACFEGTAAPYSASHLRIVGYGNDQNPWNSYAEIVVDGEAISMDKAIVTASSNDGNMPANTVDGDLESRWSSLDMGEWICFAFTAPQTITGVSIASWLGDQRRSFFAVDISQDGTTWVRIYLGAGSGETSSLESHVFTEEDREFVPIYAQQSEELRLRIESLQASMLPEQGVPGWADKHLGLVTLYLDRFERGRLGAHPDRDTIHLGEVIQATESLERGDDFLGSLRGQYRGAHFSTADASGQPFILDLPVDYDPQGSYPLVVHLHGHGVRPDLQPDEASRSRGAFFRARPTNRGDTYYEGLGEVSVIELVDYMLRNYPIDKMRVHLTGYSMGGHGTWSMATRYPDRFASVTPFFGYLDYLLPENLMDVPLWNSHGLQDFRVHSGQSDYIVSQLNQHGKDLVYRKYPNSGHSANGMEVPISWQLDQMNQGRDAAFTFTSDHPLRGRHYWSRILQAKDPHLPSTVTAKVAGQAIRLDTANIVALEITPTKLPQGSQPTAIVIDETTIPVRWPLPEESMFLCRDESGWRSMDTKAGIQVKRRPYTAGGAGNLYTGEPLMVVYGTTADAERTVALKALAEMISLRCNPDARGYDKRSMVDGGFPLIRDREVTVHDQEQFNLIIVGGPEENSLAASIWPDLPVVTNDDSIKVADLKPLPREGMLLQFTHTNPVAPDRLVFSIDPTGLQTQEILDLVRRPRLLLPGMLLQFPGSAPDLIAYRGDRICRMMQYDSDWNWSVSDDYAIPLPPAFGDPRELHLAYAEAIRKFTGTDFGLYPGDRWGEDRSYDPVFATLGDWRINRTRLAAFIGTVSGAMLQEVQNTLVAEGRVILSPSPRDIEPERLYTIASFPSMTWQINRLKRNFESVEAGPEIGPFLLDGAF